MRALLVFEGETGRHVLSPEQVRALDRPAIKRLGRLSAVDADSRLLELLHDVPRVELENDGTVVSAVVTLEALLVIIVILGAGMAGYAVGFDEGKEDAAESSGGDAEGEQGGDDDAPRQLVHTHQR